MMRESKGNEEDAGQRNYLQTEAMWGRGSIGGCPDYASDLSAFNLRVIIVYIPSFRHVDNTDSHHVIPGA